MANTIALSPDIKGSKLIGAIVTIDTYAAGGVALGVSQTGMRQIDGVGILGVTGRNVRAAYISDKIVLYGIKPEVVCYPTLACAASAEDRAGTTAAATLKTAHATYQLLVAEVAAYTAAHATTGLTIIADKFDAARNVSLLLSAAGTGTVTTSAVTYTITGKYRGVTQTDTITIAAGISIADTKGILVLGTKPFDSVTSIIASAVQTGTNYANSLISAGFGTVLGLPTALANGVFGDIKIITKAGVNIPAVTGAVPGAGRLNASLDGVDVGNIVATNSVMIKYLGVGQAQEIPDGTLSPAAVVACLVAGF